MTAAEFKAIRQRLGLSTRQLAEQLGLQSERNILRIEANEAQPTRIMELAMWALAEGLAR